MAKYYSLIQIIALNKGVSKVEETDEIYERKKLLWDTIDDYRRVNQRLEAIAALGICSTHKYIIPEEEKYHRSRVGAYYNGYMLLSSKKKDLVTDEYYVYYLTFT